MKSKLKCLYLLKCKIGGVCILFDYKNKRLDFIKIDCFFNIEKKRRLNLKWIWWIKVCLIKLKYVLIYCKIT